MENHEESDPFLSKGTDEKTAKKLGSNAGESPAITGQTIYGWTVNGLPALGQVSVVGEPVERAHWDSSLCACLGRNDDFCSSDLEVCMSSLSLFPLPLLSPSLTHTHSRTLNSIYVFANIRVYRMAI